MKKMTIPRIYVFAFIAIFMFFPLLMMSVGDRGSVQVEAMALGSADDSMILTDRQAEAKAALMQCMQSDALFSVKTSAGDRVYRDELGVFFEAETQSAWADSSEAMTISGKEAAERVFAELFAYGLVEAKGYVAQIYPVVESTYNGEKDVFENDTVVYYEIIIEKQASEDNPIGQIRSIYNNNGLVSFGLYGE